MDLIRNFSAGQFARALESWDWLGINSKTASFASPFGDVFFRAKDGFWWLDTLEATLTRPWADIDELKATLNTPGGQDRYLLAGLAAGAERQGIVPSATQVYGFKIAPIKGGEMRVGNIEAIDFVSSLTRLGDMHRQMRGRTPGSQFSGAAAR